MHIESTDPTAIVCTICQQVIEEPEEGRQCIACQEYICESCPAFGCACVYDDAPTLNAMRLALRQAATERARLEALHAFMGADALPALQQSRLSLLRATVRTLTDQVNRLDEVRCGEEYPEDLAC